ncbi:UNVERIFIED_CONTAM: hypothetical protein FKN15_071542 [Acipenser sinensis]
MSGTPSTAYRETSSRPTENPAAAKVRVCVSLFNAVTVLLLCYLPAVRRQTLRESAAAYTAASSKRCLLEQVEVFTGEEEESRVMQITCKLFVFEKSTGSWLERGRGVLRLNDMATEESGNLQSRLVMRNQGNLKVILNSKLWAQMNVFKPARKKLCFTATDLENQVVRVFLIQRTRYTGQSKTTAFLSDQLKPSVIRQRKPSRIDLSIEPADTEYQNVFRSVEQFDFPRFKKYSLYR